MYTPVIDPDTKEIIGWDKKPQLDADLVVIDEASMVPKELYDDLMSYGVPVLYVGDHHQLPPVSQNEFNLMADPFIKLDTPHRFAANSPIIKLATKIRNREPVPFGHHGGLVFKRRMADITEKERSLFFKSEELKNGEAIIICGFNKSRTALNNNVRKQFNYEGTLNYGERVICLKNNTRHTNIPLYNGSIGTVRHITRKFDKTTKLHIEMDGIPDNFNGSIYNDIFGTEKPELYRGREHKVQCFDYGYAISGHKSQGSQWKRVTVFEEQCQLWDPARWLYTCVTRSEGELLLISK
jgi:exodeoxyribonuclease-5